MLDMVLRDNTPFGEAENARQAIFKLDPKREIIDGWFKQIGIYEPNESVTIQAMRQQYDALKDNRDFYQEWRDYWEGKAKDWEKRVYDIRTRNSVLEKENAMLNRRATGIRKLQAEVKEKDEEIAALQQKIAELEVLDQEPPSADELVWVVIRDHDPDDYMVFIEKDDAEGYCEDYNDSAGDAGNASLHAELSTNSDFARCKVVDGELVRGRNQDQPPKRVDSAEIVWVDEDEDEDENPQSAPPASPVASKKPAKKRKRNTHFGGEPDHDTWVKINVLLKRLAGGRLDNRSLITFLIDQEFSHPTNPPPRGDNRPPRGDHFGAYPAPETWIKINQLRRRHHLDNTEIIQWLIAKEHGSLE
jgi:hypothetical protein